jgi:hypothetical protein
VAQKRELPFGQCRRQRDVQRSDEWRTGLPQESVGLQGGSFLARCGDAGLQIRHIAQEKAQRGLREPRVVHAGQLVEAERALLAHRLKHVVASRCVSVKLRAHTAITAAQRST